MNANQEATDGVTVHIQYASAAKELPSPELLRSWALCALEARAQEGEVVVRIVDEDEIRRLNHTYRGKDQPTNVLSFPFEIPSHVPREMLGDVVICAAVVTREAKEQGKDQNAHWAHMVVHGVLHLLGYDHLERDQAETMERLEAAILASLGFPNPYE